MKSVEAIQMIAERFETVCSECDFGHEGFKKKRVIAETLVILCDDCFENLVKCIEILGGCKVPNNSLED